MSSCSLLLGLPCQGPWVAAKRQAAYTLLMILGHVALAGVAKRTCSERESFVFLAACALFPDFLDKPLSMFFSMPGRGVGHSLIVFLSVAATAWILGPKLKVARSAVFSGLALWLTHLAGDLVAWKVLFWPFLGPLDPATPFHFWEKIYQFYVARLYPEQFWLDVACVVAAVSIQTVLSAKSKFSAVASEPPSA
jgi:membrane-bound metal-dependent hydrolase YbcI (DUF457 family)